MSTRRVPVEGGSAAKTRQRIVDAATVAFAAKGYAATSVSSDVLEPAGVSAGSFYHQFADKSELFAAVVGEAATAAQEVMKSVVRTDASRDVHQAAHDSWFVLLTMIDRYEPLFRIHMRERANPDPAVAEPLDAVKETWTAALQSSYGIASGAPSGFPTELASEMVVAFALGVIQIYLDRDSSERELRRGELADQLAAFTIGGLAGLYGRERGAAATAGSEASPDSQLG